jgi:hypothetical protein
MSHRVEDVIDSKMEGRRSVVHGHFASVEPLPEFTDVVVIIQSHHQIGSGANDETDR